MTTGPCAGQARCRVRRDLGRGPVTATSPPELLRQGAISVVNSPHKFAALIRNECAIYAQMIQAAGIKAE